MISDLVAKENYANGNFVGENSEPLLCKLQEGPFLQCGSTMLMFHGDPLLRRFTEIIDRVIEAGLYNFWISMTMHRIKIKSRKMSLVHPLDGYYSFNLYHMQPAFFILLMGSGLCSFCFMVEFWCNRVLRK
jgi:hypothetical protein